METIARTSGLDVLENELQHRLLARFSHLKTVRVECAVDREKLMVWVQHPIEISLEEQHVFATLQHTVHEFYRDRTAQVRLYLRRLGQKQPYAVHAFKMLKPTEPQPTEPQSNPVQHPQVSPPPPPPPLLPLNPDAQKTPDAIATPSATEASVPLVHTAHTAHTAETSATLPASVHSQTVDPFPQLPLPELGPESELELEPELEPLPEPLPDGSPDLDALFEQFQIPRRRSSVTAAPPQPVKRGWNIREWTFQMWLPFLVAGAGVSVVVIGSLGYMLTRPCVIGKCPEIDRSRHLGQTAIQALDSQQSTSVMMTARQQIQQAQSIVQDIPRWSLHYQTAQNLLKTYQMQMQMFDRAVAAIEQGARAAQQSQNPPHTSKQWKAIQNLWQGAIDELEKIPASSPVSGFAQQKISEYQANLDAVAQRVALEQKAAKQLNTAKSTVEIAQTRQGTAQDLTAWQQTYAAWQTAMYALRRVPDGTMAGKEAKQLFAGYEKQALSVRDRQMQEQVAADLYNRALSFGDRAKKAQDRGLWTEAIEQWQQGLAYAGQVQEGTSAYEAAQALLTSYKRGLDSAQQGMVVQGIIQRAESELAQICNGPTPICEYTVTRDLIKVNILPSYIDYVRTLTQTTNQKGDYNTRTRIEEHKQALIKNFELVSNHAKIPIELYNKADGSSIGSHKPK
jgi:tetratricopeptide (TPR) repeat protein